MSNLSGDELNHCGDGEIRGRLTRKRICEAALDLIDESGIEALSMRSLAARVGVKAASLYHYYDGKDALLSGVSELLYGRVNRPSGADTEWADEVRQAFRRVQQLVQAHPNAAPLVVRGLINSPEAEKRANELLNAVSTAGLDEDASTKLVGNLVALLVGHSLIASWGGGIQLRDTSNAGLAMVATSTAAEKSAVTQAYASGDGDLSRGPNGGRHNGDDYLLAGLDALIKGFSAD